MMKKLIFILLAVTIVIAGEKGARGGWTSERGSDKGARQSYLLSGQAVNCDTIALDSIAGPDTVDRGGQFMIWGRYGCFTNAEKDSLDFVLRTDTCTIDSLIDTAKLYITIGDTVDTGMVDTIAMELDTGTSSLYDSLINGVGGFGGLYIAEPWSITTNPHDTTVTNGETVHFHIAGTGTGTPTYVWLCDSGGGSGVKKVVGGEADDTLTVTALTAMDGWLYWGTVSNSRGADTSTAATLNVAVDVYTLTVTSDGYGSTVPSGAVEVEQGVGTAIAATPVSYYHFLNWTVTAGSGASFLDATAASTYCTLSTGNATVRSNFGIDTFTVTVVDGDNVDLTILNGASKGFNTVCSVGVDVDVGYAYKINGEAAAYADDTLLITVAGDSTVTGVSYAIPVIDSVRPNPWYYGKVVSFYTKNAGSSQGVGYIELGGENLGATPLWGASLVNDTIPSGMTRGKKQVIIHTNDGIQGIAADSLNVFRPYAR